MMAGYSILRFYPMEVIHSFKFIRTWNRFIYLWLCLGCALGRNWWTASALDVVHLEGKGKGKAKICQCRCQCSDCKDVVHERRKDSDNKIELVEGTLQVCVCVCVLRQIDVTLSTRCNQLPLFKATHSFSQ